MSQEQSNESPPLASEDQPGRQVRLCIDDQHVQPSYVNAFRTNVTPEEVILDAGMDMLVQTAAQGRRSEDQPVANDEIHFNVGSRLVMNYYTAKRLAIVLGQLIHRYEEKFGELKIDSAQRTVDNAA